MGMRPKPTALKVIQGTARKDRMVREAIPTPALPDPPDHLDERALREWNRVGPELYRLGLLSEVDRAVFAAYCICYSRWEFAEERVMEMSLQDPQTGALVIRTKNGNTIHNPMLCIARAALHDLMVLSDRIGLNPSARSRIDVEQCGKAQEQKKTVAQKYFSQG
jgi:P27 family predicted phage terminase small subunit